MCPGASGGDAHAMGPVGGLDEGGWRFIGWVGAEREDTQLRARYTQAHRGGHKSRTETLSPPGTQPNSHWLIRIPQMGVTAQPGPARVCSCPPHCPRTPTSILASGPRSRTLGRR